MSLKTLISLPACPTLQSQKKKLHFLVIRNKHLAEICKLLFKIKLNSFCLPCCKLCNANDLYVHTVVVFISYFFSSCLASLDPACESPMLYSNFNINCQLNHRVMGLEGT